MSWCRNFQFDKQPTLNVFPSTSDTTFFEICVAIAPNPLLALRSVDLVTEFLQLGPEENVFVDTRDGMTEVCKNWSDYKFLWAVYGMGQSLFLGLEHLK